jgi:hypothetical protein
VKVQTDPTAPPANELHERLKRAIGTARQVRKAGTLECYVRSNEPGAVYVLDTCTGVLFHEPMLVETRTADGWALPNDGRLLERHIRLMCSIDDPLTVEDAYALMGNEVESMVSGIDLDPELFDLTVPGGGLPLMQLPELARIVKHPNLPVFAVGLASPRAHLASCSTNVAVLRR